MSVNRTTKVARVYIESWNGTYVDAAVFLSTLEDFKRHFSRMISTIQAYPPILPVDDYLGLYGMPLLFPLIIRFLVFFGRAMELSVTSTTIHLIFCGVPVRRFFPGGLEVSSFSKVSSTIGLSDIPYFYSPGNRPDGFHGTVFPVVCEGYP